MKKLMVIEAVLAGFLASPTLAADIIPPVLPPPYRPPVVLLWTGVYIGGNIGGHWGNDFITTAADPLGWGAVAASEINSDSAGALHPDGVIGGLQTGFNWQADAIVLGLEADADWAGGTGSRTLNYTGAFNFNPADVMTNATKETFLATVRPRLGLAVGHALMYWTGGVAIGRLKVTDSFCTFGCPAGIATDLAVVSATSTRTGWTAGGGFEWRVWGGWTLKAEYLYVNLGTLTTRIPSCTGCAPGSDITVNHKYSDNIVRFGINYLFAAGSLAAGY